MSSGDQVLVLVRNLSFTILHKISFKKQLNVKEVERKDRGGIWSLSICYHIF